MTGSIFFRGGETAGGDGEGFAFFVDWRGGGRKAVIRERLYFFLSVIV